MPVFETFAARKKASEQSGVVDVYIYDSLPTFLRRQLVLLFTSCIGPGHRSDDYYTVENNNRAWDFIAGVMCREVESFSPISGMALSFDQCMTYLQTSTDIDGVLSLVEICCRYMHTVVTTLNRHERENLGITQEARDGLKEISARFRQNAVGYSCDEGRIIRVDSEFVHAEIVKDALGSRDKVLAG